MNPVQELEMLEELIDELLAGIQDVLQSGEILSDEFQGAIAQELEQTTNRIDQLRNEISRTENNTVPLTPLNVNPSPDAQQSLMSARYLRKKLLLCWL